MSTIFFHRTLSQPRLLAFAEEEEAAIVLPQKLSHQLDLCKTKRSPHFSNPSETHLVFGGAHIPFKAVECQARRRRHPIPNPIAAQTSLTEGFVDISVIIWLWSFVNLLCVYCIYCIYCVYCIPNSMWLNVRRARRRRHPVKCQPNPAWHKLL